MAKTARRCPSCSSTNTVGFGRKGLQMCEACAYRWVPCSDQYCRGYRVALVPMPHAIGCPECDSENGGVSTEKVQWWPETYRAIARALDNAPEGDTGSYPLNHPTLLRESAHGQ